MHRYRFARDFTLYKAAALVALIGLAGLLNAAQVGTDMTQSDAAAKDVGFRIVPVMFFLDADCGKEANGVSL